MAVALTEGVKAAALVATTIASINDQNKRRKFEQSLALLSNSQQNELNQKLLKAQTQNERLQILTNSMLEYAIANEQSQDKNNTLMYFLAGGLGITLIVVALIFSLKKGSHG